MASQPTQPTKFDRGYKVLHWVMALLFMLMLLAGQGFAAAQTDQDTMTMLMGHSSLGSLLMLLFIIRFTKRFIVRSPQPKHPMAMWQQRLATAMHYALYLFMVLIPITGYLTASQHELPVQLLGSFNLSLASVSAYDESLFLTFRSLHVMAINSFTFLLVGHIGAALFHAVALKDSVLRSMTFDKRKKQPLPQTKHS